jgi:hypothetical protein
MQTAVYNIVHKGNGNEPSIINIQAYTFTKKANKSITKNQTNKKQKVVGLTKQK